MSRSAAPSWLAIVALGCFALGTFGQTAEKPSVSASASATNTTTANNNIGKEVFDAIRGCKANEAHQNSRGTVGVLDMMRPKTKEFMDDFADGKIKSYDPSRYKDCRNGILILVDPASKIPFNTNVWATYISALCTLAVGNEANVLVIDMTSFKDEDKKFVRSVLLEKLGSKITGQTNSRGEKLDFEKLLSERQVNTIALIGLDESKPTELTPFHSHDVRYEAKVGSLIDKAYATYESWTKPEAGSKAKEKVPEEKPK